MFNATFYPTPGRLIDKMIGKVEGIPINILDPSAGKGDILNKLKDSPGGVTDVSMHLPLRRTQNYGPFLGGNISR